MIFTSQKHDRMSSMLAALEQKHCNLTKIKVDKVFSFVCHVASKVSANNYMPVSEKET